MMVILPFEAHDRVPFCAGLVYLLGGARTTTGVPVNTVEMRFPNDTWVELPQRMAVADKLMQTVAFE